MKSYLWNVYTILKDDKSRSKDCHLILEILEGSAKVLLLNTRYTRGDMSYT